MCIARLRANASNALRYGSHSVTCKQHHLPLLPVAEYHRPLVGTHCTYPRSDGQSELTWVVGWTEINFPHQELNPDTVTHPSTNRARRRLTSLIWPTYLPTAPSSYVKIFSLICHNFATEFAVKQLLLSAYDQEQFYLLDIVKWLKFSKHFTIM